MNTDDAVVNLFALAHPGRLAMYQVIVAAGAEGIAAGQVARMVNMPANTASTHLSIMTGAGLLSAHREGRSIIYSADMAHFSKVIGFLLKDCAQGRPEAYESLRTWLKDKA